MGLKLIPIIMLHLTSNIKSSRQLLKETTTILLLTDSIESNRYAIIWALLPGTLTAKRLVSLKRVELAEVLMVEEALGLMSYLMHSLGLFSSWGCAKSIGQPLVFLNCLVCNLLVERQIISIPHKFSFIEYYYFIARRGFSIGLQGIHKLPPLMFHTCWWIHMGYYHSSFHHVLLGHHVHYQGHEHTLYLHILWYACVHLCQGLRYWILKSYNVGWL